MATKKKDRPATKGEVGRLLTAVCQLSDEVAVLRSRLPLRQTSAQKRPEELVTLVQLAVLLRRTKRTMERYLKRMPPPRVRGRRGCPQQWDWKVIRPWLESTFDVSLPQHFPASGR
jgi:hypothetical protein